MEVVVVVDVVVVVVVEVEEGGAITDKLLDVVEVVEGGGVVVGVEDVEVKTVEVGVEVCLIRGKTVNTLAITIMTTMAITTPSVNLDIALDMASPSPFRVK